MARFLIALTLRKIFLLVFVVAFCSCSKKANEVPVNVPLNEQPMYGGIPRTAYEQKIDQEFIDAVVQEAGSREAAFDKAMELGWHWYYKKDYPQAMRRFNQAWLLNPEHPAVFHGFGTTLGSMGRRDEFIKWNKKSAEMGWGNAQINMGWAYLRGYGVQRNLEEAVRWYRKAAEQNHPTGLNMLGLFYDWGYGVPRDPEQAERLYDKADQEGFKGDWKQLRRHILIAQDISAANITFQEILDEVEKRNPL